MLPTNWNLPQHEHPTQPFTFTSAIQYNCTTLRCFTSCASLHGPGYDEEARYFESHVRAAKRAELVERAHAAVQELHLRQVDALRDQLLTSFRSDLSVAIASD